MAANWSSDWSDEETVLLISIWGDQKIQEKLDRFCRKQEVVFREISKAMREGGFDKTAAQCQSKTEALRTNYHDVLDHNHMSRGRDCITMPFFSELDEFLRHRPTSRPRLVIESMVLTEDESDSEDSDDNTNSSSDWSDEETALLISIWGDQEIQKKLIPKKLDKVNGKQKVFEEISKAMGEGGFDKTAAQCRWKTKALRWKYNDVLDHNQLNGRNKWITMPFFSELDQFLRYLPIRRRPSSAEYDSDSGDSDDNTSLDCSDLSGSENDGDQSDSDSDDSQSSRSSTSSSGSNVGDNNAPQAKRGKFSSALRRRGGNGTRQKRNKMKAALEAFAKGLQSSYSKSIEEDFKFQLELQKKQFEHEVNMWKKILQTFASFLRPLAWHQPQGPAPVQLQGAWGSAGQQQPYSGGGAGPVPPRGQVQRYIGGLGGPSPVPPQGQVQPYSGGCPVTPQGQQQPYRGGWGGAGPVPPQGQVQRYSGGWGGASLVSQQGQVQPYSGGPVSPQGQMQWGGAALWQDVGWCWSHTPPAGASRWNWCELADDMLIVVEC
ncbi:uncharacterized protein LOC118422153 [Branchiostoma floridae]|uniref:Uncharacterized protein LOC118422153 n=1 Tax=Branchiostoma floridae TaxID=7739 RepID=A0A9J7LNQ4_BRAFL|nr:uncharacterized protein LOC118422153 [Branchiostoma floridae]